MKKTILAASLALIVSPVFAQSYANGPMSVNLSSTGGAASSAIVSGTGAASAGASHNASSYGSAGSQSQYQSYSVSGYYQDYNNYYYSYGGGVITLQIDSPFGSMTVTGSSDDYYNYNQYLQGSLSGTERTDKAWADGGQQMNVDTFANAEHNGDGVADANATAGGYNNVSVQNGDAYYNSPN